MKKALAIILIVGTLATPACTHMTPEQQGALSGGAIGAGAGAGISAISGGSAGIGAAIGGGLGALGGWLYGRQQRY